MNPPYPEEMLGLGIHTYSHVFENGLVLAHT